MWLLPNVAFVFLFSLSTVNAQCNPKLPNCRPSGGGPLSNAACKPFYLIPGKANECTRNGPNKVLSIDPSSVQLKPNPIKLPGCFTVQMNVELTEGRVPKNMFARVEYNWLNVPQFANLPCQNQSADGCNGYGNKCYYCDICNTLNEIKGNSRVAEDRMLSQLKDINCPEKAGIYQLKKEFCFNDFKEFDKDNDCQLDFLQNNQIDPTYRESIDKIQVSGYGTVLAKFVLANNASDEQQQQKLSKEQDIERTIDGELENKRRENNWAINDAQYITFKNWFIQFRKQQWHKSEYLPWLIYTNEIGCLIVSFNVCDKEPVFDGQNWNCPRS